MEYPTKLKKEIMEQSKKFQLEGFLPGRGAEDAAIMLVAEAPGQTEIKTQIPFSGQAGKGLDKVLAKINLYREDIYMTSVVKSRPYSVKQRTNKSGEEKKSYPNRTPNQTEIKLFAPFLDFEIKSIAPKVIVTLGNSAMNRLLGNQYTVSNYHGQTLQQPIYKLSKDRKNYEKTEKNYYIYPMYHPAAMLYNRDLEKTIDQDWDNLYVLIRKITSNTKKKK
ncbi:uracil-DNA glycosylase [Tetragenococcus halophilus]|uniref:uracil-DNA glycosylase n=1 Tax=Tetragenococcus halophilus TaxID=51669 RepID=UPI000B927135|nr:uracil-DNA glycosylase [Tetragenococcus halophilus]MCF1602003.1 uracil-DNA glycosylase [Tetragenococcus halophilus]